MPTNCTIKLYTGPHVGSERCVLFRSISNLYQHAVMELCFTDPLFFMHHAVSDYLNKSWLTWRLTVAVPHYR